MGGSARLRRVSAGMLGLAGALALLGAAAEPAEARTEQVRWRYSAPGRVTGFRVHVGPSSGSYTQTIDVGKPRANDSGVYAYGLVVPDNQTVYVAVTAYDASQQSPYSNQTTRLAATSNPPPSNPPPSNPPPSNPPPTNPPPTNPPPTNPPPTNPPPTEPPPSEPSPEPGPSPHGEDGRPQLREGFGAYEEGMSPEGWVDTGPNNSRGVDDALFGVLELGRNKVLGTASAASDIHSHYVTTESQGWSRYEFSGRMRAEDPAGGVGVTVLSQYPERDAYYRLRRGADPDFQMAPRPDGQDVYCSLPATGVTPKAERWYKFRIQVSAEDDGTRLRAKVWKRGTKEPGAWQIDCFDTSETRLSQGVPGLWSSGPGTKLWDDLKVVPLRHELRRDRPKAPPAKPIIGE